MHLYRLYTHVWWHCCNHFSQTDSWDEDNLLRSMNRSMVPCSEPQIFLLDPFATTSFFDLLKGSSKIFTKKNTQKNRPNDWCSSGKISQITLYKQTMSFGWTSSNNPSPTTKHAKAWRPWQSVTVTRRNPWNCLLVFWYPILKTVGIQKSFFVAHVHIRFVMYGNLISRWPGTHQSSISPTQNPLFHERVPTLLILTDLLTAPTPKKLSRLGQALTIGLDVVLWLFVFFWGETWGPHRHFQNRATVDDTFTRKCSFQHPSSTISRLNNCE